MDRGACHREPLSVDELSRRNGRGWGRGEQENSPTLQITHAPRALAFVSCGYGRTGFTLPILLQHEAGTDVLWRAGAILIRWSFLVPARGCCCASSRGRELANLLGPLSFVGSPDPLVRGDRAPGGASAPSSLGCVGR